MKIRLFLLNILYIDVLSAVNIVLIEDKYKIVIK